MQGHNDWFDLILKNHVEIYGGKKEGNVYAFGWLM